MSRGTDVAIVGGGVIGTALARELARRDRSVVVLERDSPGRRATWSAAGMLSPAQYAELGGPLLELADEGLNRYPAFVHALREETGIDVEYRTNGKLYVALGEEAGAELRALAEGPHATRFGMSLLPAEEARELEPEISGEVALGLLVRRDHRVNNRLLAQALAAAATRGGASIRTGTPAVAVAVANHRVVGVRLTSGQLVAAERVVIAAGAWSGGLEGLPGELPVFPVKGEMLAVDGRARVPGRGGRSLLERVVYGLGAYLIPREDGRILVGATVERSGFRGGPTPRGIGSLIERACRLVPALADLPLVETWAGFRPGTEDRLPIIGPDLRVEGLYYATGHFGHGILLAPLTAQALADLLIEGRSGPLLERFGPARFQAGP